MSELHGQHVGEADDVECGEEECGMGDSRHDGEDAAAQHDENIAGHVGNFEYDIDMDGFDDEELSRVLSFADHYAESHPPPSSVSLSASSSSSSSCAFTPQVSTPIHSAALPPPSSLSEPHDSYPPSPSSFSSFTSSSVLSPHSSAIAPLPHYDVPSTPFNSSLLHPGTSTSATSPPPTDQHHETDRLEPQRHHESQQPQQQHAAHPDDPHANSNPALCAHLFNFTHDKAGMGAADKARVNQVVMEMSKGTAFFQNEQKKARQVDKHVAQMKKDLDALSPFSRSLLESTARSFMAEVEAGRRLDKLWIVVDMDMYFAAVEMRDNPSLIGKPVAVGSMSMISTANYEARKFGVRSAMPGFIARKLCPDLIFVKTNFDKYSAVAEQCREVFREYDPQFEACSLDEAYLEVSSLCRERGTTAPQIAEEIRDKIFRKTRLTASCGIACNRMLAKICSDINKPNGQYYLPPNRQEIIAFMDKLGVRKIPGVGKVTERMLVGLGVTQCSQLKEHAADLVKIFTPLTWQWLLRASLGIGDSIHESGGPRKSISQERTFQAIGDPNVLAAKTEDICRNLAKQIEEEGIEGKTVTVKLKTAAFKVLTRAQTLTRYVSTYDEIFPIALRLLRAELPLRLRLLGVRLSTLRDKPTTSKTQADADSKDQPSEAGDAGEAHSDTAAPTDPARTPPAHSIPSLFSKANTQVESMRRQCPVCHQCLTINALEFGRHVDACLDKAAQKGRESEGSQSEKEKEKWRLTPKRSDVGVVKKSPISQQRTTPARPSSKGVTQQKKDGKLPRSSASLDFFRSATQPPPSNSRTVPCPVCQSPVSMAAINTHLDQCAMSRGKDKGADKRKRTGSTDATRKEPRTSVSRKQKAVCSSSSNAHARHPKSRKGAEADEPQVIDVVDIT